MNQNNREIANEYSKKVLPEYRAICNLEKDFYGWPGEALISDFILHSLDAKDADWQSKLDAAVKEAVEKCAAAATEAITSGVSITVNLQNIIRQAILATIAPNVPVWEHKPDCVFKYEWIGGRWLGRKDKGCGEHTPVELKVGATHCDGCGTPRPEVKR